MHTSGSGQALSPAFLYLAKLFRIINLNLDTTKVVQVLVVFHWLKFKSIASQHSTSFSLRDQLSNKYFSKVFTT